MRDPERIDPFLTKLAEFWKTVPDWRFGQLIMNLTRNIDSGFEDPWDWEEAEWEEKIKEWNAKDTCDPTDEEIADRVQEILHKIRFE